VVLDCFGRDINFAALTVGERWLENYGDGAVFFRDSMIAHRSSVFEENTARWVETNGCTLQVQSGHMATWEERHKLGVAKIAPHVLGGFTDIPSLLLQSGDTTADDSYIEVHICGTFTIRSAQTIVVKRDALSPLSEAALLSRSPMLRISVRIAP